MIDTLLDDIRLTLDGDTPHGRRAAVRAMFAAVEGILWSLKRDLLADGEFKLSQAQIALLREEQYQVAGDGSAETRKLLIRLRDNIRFTVHIVNSLYSEYSVNYSEPGWQSLMESMKVRDRLMHPKAESDLEVTSEELKQALDGVVWFANLISDGRRALGKFLETPEVQQRRLERALVRYVAENAGKPLGGLGQFVEPGDPRAWKPTDSA